MRARGVERRGDLVRFPLMSRAPFALAASVALLAGCADPVPAGSDSKAANPRVPDFAASGSPAATPAMRSGTTLVPDTLSADEWRRANLRGELGCAFARAPDEGPLFFATSYVGDAATPEGVIKLDDQVVKLLSQTRGGFAALGRGGRFLGPDNLLVRIDRESPRISETPAIAEESPRYPARLILSLGGRELSVEGIWECGP